MNSDCILSLLRRHPFTQGFWPEHIDRLAAMAAALGFRADDLIFQEGDDSSLFYLLTSGSVALEVVSPGRPIRVSTLFAGDVLGWSSVMGGTVKQFQARALEEVQVLAFDGARLRHAFEEDYGFGFRFMRAGVTVKGGRLRATRTQLVEIYSPLAGAAK